MKKAGRIIVSVLLWIIILVAAMFAFVTLATKDQNRLASIGGITPLMIESDSMKPTFEKGDLIFIKKTNPEKLAVGDIVTFHTIIENQYALNTHRIVAITEDGGMRHYVTQGDNNPVQDQHIIVDGDIAGKYIGKIKGFGKVMSVLSSKVGFFLIIVLPMLLFFIYQVYHLVMVSIELKKANAIEAALATEEISTKKADQKMDEAEKALEEAKRLKAEAEAALAKAKEMNEKK